MFENERKYFLENIIPAFEDFLNFRGQNEWGENQLLRLGLIAAESLFDFREHLSTDIQLTRPEVEALNSDYKIVADIVNAKKHKTIDRNNPIVTNAEQIYEMLVFTFFKDEQGEYLYPQLDVFVKLNNGQELLLLPLFDSVIHMWERKLIEWGIVKKIRLPEINLNTIKTRVEAEQREAPAKIHQGEAYDWIMKFQKYNYEKGIIEPIDISKDRVELKVLKLPDSIPLTMQTRTGESVDIKIPLSITQAEEYIKLQSKEKKEHYINDLIKVDPEIKKMILDEFKKINQTKK